MFSELKQGATSPQVSHFIIVSRRMPVSLPESLPVILTNSFSVLYRTSPKNICELPAYFFNPFLIKEEEEEDDNNNNTKKKERRGEKKVRFLRHDTLQGLLDLLSTHIKDNST